ncbi:MAG: TRAP transporter permease [Alphaproteobacteria bacterium]
MTLDKSLIAPHRLRDRLVFWLGVAISLAHLYANLLGTLPELWMSALHFALFAALTALILPTLSLRAALSISLLALAGGVYVIIGEQPLFERGLMFSPLDWIFALGTILLALELVRRTTGLFIPVVIILAVFYVVWWGRYVPGVLHFPGLSLETIAFRSYFSGDGMFGPIARISSTFVFMFILFGAFLIRSGAGEFVIEMAKAVAGKITGGPGFVAVMSSGLTGTVTGSAVANTVTTGVITIPLMKRAGFPPKFAAGVEAAASTGGQLMPPIMGAGAFVMASYTQIPYLQIVAVSLLPALLYFASICFFVRIEAKKRGIAATDEDGPALGKVLVTRGPSFLIPIAVLIWLLVDGFTPTYAAGIAILTVIVSSWLTPDRMGPRAIVEALALGARNMAFTAVLLVTIGLVVNAVATTGIGATFSIMISSWADGNLFIAILLVAAASLVLGAGLPVTASYIVLATLSAPALYHMIAGTHLVEALMNGTLAEGAIQVLAAARPELAEVLGAPMTKFAAEQLAASIAPDLMPLVVDRGLDAALLTTALLSAHMIIFWLSQDSNVTPPVCLVAFAAAAIAKTPPVATGFMAWKIAKGLYIIPFLFAYTPILSGDWLAALQVFGFALVGVYALAGALDGYLERPLIPLLRALSALAGVMLLWPEPLTINLTGLAIFAVLFAVSRRAASA